MNLKKFVLPLALSLAGGGLVMTGGCASDPAMTPPGGQMDPIPDDAYPRITIEWPLQEYLAVSYDAIIVDNATAEKPMHVYVPMRSMSDSQMFVQYRFVWFDAGGRELDNSGWRATPVEPRLKLQFDANAMTSKAADWRLEVRSAR